MKRMMCVYLPNWSLQRLEHERTELRSRPLVLVNPHAVRGPKIVCASPRALRSGIRAGMSVADALTIDRHVCLEEENPGKDLAALRELAKWAERYSPLVAVEDGAAPQSLLLDITGCAPHPYPPPRLGEGKGGGEDRLLQRAVREWTELGWNARLAIADTVGAAWGLAHCGETPVLVPPGQTEKFLGPLPVIALRLSSDILDLLAGLGLEQIDQLIVLPRSSLCSRFGPTLLQRLDQALGRLPEVLAPHRWVAPLQASWAFEPATDRRQDLNHVLDRLTHTIQEMLHQRHQNARQIECWFYHESTALAPRRIEVNLCRASQSFAYLRMLLRARLDQVVIAAPVCGMRLHVSAARDAARSLAAREDSEFFAAPSSDDLEELIDRLGSRLGYEALTRPVLVPDPQPEYACRLEPLVDIHGEPSGVSCRLTNRGLTPLGSPLRPLRLYPEPALIEAMSVVPDGPPRQFRWNGVDYRITHASGPERIETGWWRHRDVQRDYYAVVTHVGNRFWLFRRRDDGRWFVHGCFE